MLSAGLMVAVALVVSSHGAEGTREEKFRGALLAQASPADRAFAEPPDAKHELAALRANPPSFETGVTVLAFGCLFTFVGLGGSLLTLAFVGALGEAGALALMLAAGVVGLGSVLGVAGGIVMAIVGTELKRHDARIQELERSTQRFAVPPHLVLARF